MKLTNDADVLVYTVSGASTARPLPDWLERRRKRSLKNDPEYANRVELLQDFEFNQASTAIRVSEDGQWTMSTGVYKPQFHVHNLRELSLSFSRHTESENVTFQLLAEDYSKSIHLQSNRRIELHTPMGCHLALRLPRFGRDIQYNRTTAEAIIPASGNNADGEGEVFRLNLEEGRFMNSFRIDIGQDDDPLAGRQGGINVGSVNCAAVAERTHGLLAFGTSIGSSSNGSIEFWDPRVRARVAALSDLNSHITALNFAPNGLSIAAGRRDGIIQLFDLRRPAPILTRDQGYGEPIKNLIHMTTTNFEKKILSADRKVIKIWDEQTGEAWTAIEPIVPLNDVAWCQDTGMILTANEGSRQHAFFVPQLGSAPSWCAFLDNMVEDMAEEHHSAAATYDNYKFLTREELRDFGLDHLVGTEQGKRLLRPYMHGFFVQDKLYQQARLIANPDALAEDYKRKIQARIEKERESRIRGAKKKAASLKKQGVLQNAALAERLAENDKTKEAAQDDRFGAVFRNNNEAFVVDEKDEAFGVHYANGFGKRKDSTTAGIGPGNGHLFMDSSDDENEPAKSMSVSKSVQAAQQQHRAPIQDNGADMIYENMEAEEPQMRVSSTTVREARDETFGWKLKQAEKALVGDTSSTGRKTKRTEVLGDQEITFVPTASLKTKGGSRKAAAVEEEDAPDPSTKKRAAGRRSASGNMLRRS